MTPLAAMSSASRFDVEFQRLYGAPVDATPSSTVRALGLDVGRPSDWDLLGAVWRGVQADLGLPAPAIAIAGDNSYQLWFSLQVGCTVDDGRAFLDGLCRRYLGGIAASRIRRLTTPPELPREVKEGQWSAFVAPDLAPVFVEATWLDIPPGADGQADLLKGLSSIAPREWSEALAQFAPGGGVAGADAAARESMAVASQPASASVAFAPPTTFTDPRAFLLHVMNDAAVPLALRIDAAKALLPPREG